jgi:hypothetical protein
MLIKEFYQLPLCYKYSGLIFLGVKIISISLEQIRQIQEIIRKKVSIMTDIYELMDRIKSRPGMYLGKPHISRFKAFLDGYIGARNDLGFSLKEQEQTLNNFQQWIQKRFKITSSHSWADIILFYSLDERDALDKFFELFEKFKSDERKSSEDLVKEKTAQF